MDSLVDGDTISVWSQYTRGIFFIKSQHSFMQDLMGEDYVPKEHMQSNNQRTP